MDRHKSGNSPVQHQARLAQTATHRGAEPEQRLLGEEISRLEAQFVCLVPDVLAPVASALDRARRLGDDALLGRALSLSARAELVEGRHDAGIRIIEEALATFAKLDEQALGRLSGPYAEAWRVAGNAQVKLGNIAAALPLLDRAIGIAERGIPDDPAGDTAISSIPAASALIRCLNNMGFALLAIREMSGAMDVLHKALQVADAHPATFEDVPEDIIFSVGNLVAALQQSARDQLAAGESATAELSQARHLLETRAARIIEPARAGRTNASKVTPSAEHDYQQALSQNLLLEGKLGEALEQYRRLAENSDEDRLHGAKRGLAEVLLALGRPAEALEHAHAALAARDQNEEIVDRVAVLLILSRVHRALGQDHKALAVLDEHHSLRARLDALAARQYAQHMVARVGLERVRTEAEAQRHIANELGELNNRLVAQAVTLEVQAQALDQARTEAESANRAKSAFLANMSHELRTPLNAILGFSEMVRDGHAGPPGPAWLNYAGHVHDAGRHLLAVINDVLDLSKIEAGRVDLSIEPVALAAMFESCRELIEPMAEKNGIAFLIDCDPALPEIQADPIRLRQILLNLLSNAAKFTPSAGRIVLSAHRANEAFIEITVADTGIGMSEEELRLALEVFGQPDSTVARRQQGSGLGLPIAVRLAELHGGSLVVRSEAGVGTTVTVTLPLDQTAAS
jgi:signal transduction histidine kinase